MNTAKSATIAFATETTKIEVNKALSGKYLKLNKLEKLAKKWASGPYRGKYERGPNYLADAIWYSVDAAKEGVGKALVFAVLDVIGGNP